MLRFASTKAAYDRFRRPIEYPRVGWCWCWRHKLAKAKSAKTYAAVVIALIIVGAWLASAWLAIICG